MNEFDFVPFLNLQYKHDNFTLYEFSKWNLKLAYVSVNCY